MDRHDLSQPELVGAILTELACQGVRSVDRDQVIVIARAADSIIAAIVKEDISA